MRTLATLLALLALVISVNGQKGAHTPTCCTKFTSAIIPHEKVVSYFETSSSCFLKALVFTTVAKRKICVDPVQGWVKNVVIKVKNRLNSKGVTTTVMHTSSSVFNQTSTFNPTTTFNQTSPSPTGMSMPLK